jgi:2-polyprenyl-6-methoxyphenol hydroxylase-like FAD-dependent oxidoreductase
MRAIIVGGGIGGLASAVALMRGGWDVEVLERAAEFTEVGAGLSLWPNALRALDALGLGDQVRELSVFEGQSGVRTARGRWLSKADADYMIERFGPIVMVHRSGLLDVLLAAVPAELRRGSVTVTEVGPDGTVTHSAGSTASAGSTSADLVVGADGLRSITRRSVWPASRRDTPVTPPGGWSRRQCRSTASAKPGGTENGSATPRCPMAGSTATPPRTRPKARSTAGWAGRAG